MLTVEPIAAFTDNYIWLLHDGSRARVVDPGDAAPVLEALAARGLELDAILVTHHHYDHIGGVAELKASTGCHVYAPHNPAIGDVDTRLGDGDHMDLDGERFEVMTVPGHTLDHIAYFHAGDALQAPSLFCGDTLFAGGCGRIFEGSPPQMYASLQRLAALPDNTRVYCAHEYTLANLAFARAAEPDNPELLQREQEARRLRERNVPTVPSTLALEIATNPFLRSDQAALQLGLRGAGRDSGADPVETFAALRAWKDSF